MKVENFQYLFVLTIACFLSSCAKVNYSPNGQSLAQSHETIAVLLPTIHYKITGDESKIDSLKKAEAINLQAGIYDWLLRRKLDNKVAVDIMDIYMSNEKLAAINSLNLAVMTSGEICNLLNVDAILTSNFEMQQPMSAELASTYSIFLQDSSFKNRIGVTLALHDQESSSVFWNFNNEADEKIGLPYNDIVDRIFKKAVKKMPYYNKKFKMSRDTKIDLSEIDIF